MGHQLYKSDITTGSLMIPESREVAKLMLAGADEETWRRAIHVDNVFQKRNPATVRSQVRLIRNRLELMSAPLWNMVAEGSLEVATQALLAAAIKHSRLLGDFMDGVMKEHYRTFKSTLTNRDWELFLEVCEARDTTAGAWSPKTRQKLGQIVFKMLTEARYISEDRSLHSVPLNPELERYLTDCGEHYVLRCMRLVE